jgi:hypothetical protein
VDEAADWQIGEDIFPRYPPAGLRAVVSARTGPDERQAGWLTKIGWTDPDSAEQMTVDRLERQAFSALVQSDTLVSRLFATQLDIDEQLFKKTGGDPLLLSLYLQEVRLQLLRRNAADISLGDVPSGLAGVVSLWEDDLRARLKSAAADTLSAARRLRSVLAAAFGPLRRADLHQLCGAEVSSEAIDDAVDALSRFLVGDGDNDGYAFTHPLLGQHFYARLAERERVELDRRFVAWGRSAIEEIGNGVGTPRDVAPYLVQYLSAHMQRARVAVDELRVLLSEHWKDACFALEGTYSKFVNDVDIVRRAILEHDRKLVSDGGQPKYFADAFFCMLCESSTSEQSDNLSSFVVAAALATKIISPQQCIQLVERRTPPVIGSSKIGLLVTIVDLVPAARETLQPLIGQIVERDHPKGRDFSDAIVLNYPRVLSILDPSTRARIVAPISAWIEDRWRNWSRQAQDDPAAARLLVKDASAVPSTLQFGCIRPFLEPARARALAALYIDACDHAALDWKNRQPADVIGLLPALPSEIQFELLDAWFDDQTKTPLVQAAGWLVEMDGELGLALKQRYGPRLARHVERNGHWLDWRDIDLMSLALRWCEPPDDVPVMARLGLFIKGLLWSAPFPQNMLRSSSSLCHCIFARMPR